MESWSIPQSNQVTLGGMILIKRVVNPSLLLLLLLLLLNTDFQTFPLPTWI